MESDITFWFNTMALAVMSSLVIYLAVERNNIRSDLVERGYAIHCPVDGEFAFVGECAAQ